MKYHNTVNVKCTICASSNKEEEEDLLWRFHKIRNLKEIMELSIPHNQSYWFVVREDPNNELLTSNNFTIQAPQITEQETAYIADTSGNHQYIQVDEPVIIQAVVPEVHNFVPEVHDGVLEVHDTAREVHDTVHEVYNTVNQVHGTVLEVYDTGHEVHDTILEVHDTVQEVLDTGEEVHDTVNEVHDTALEVYDTSHQDDDTILEVQDTVPEVHDKATQKDDDFWDRDKVRQLLDLCLDVRFSCDASESRWDEIAILLETTPEECDIKYKNLRRTYFRLLKKKMMRKVVKWVHYSKAEQLFKNCSTVALGGMEPWEDVTIRKMLGLYIDHLSEFENPGCVHKNLWKVIAAQLNTTYLECYQKFINLRKTYLNLKKKSLQSEKRTNWPYYHYFNVICRNYRPVVKPWTQGKIKLLTKAYLEIARKFIDTKYQKKDMWKQISKKVGETPSDCDKKFRNLKQTYVRLKMKAESGRTVKWEHYQDFVNIFENDSYVIVDQGSEIVFKLQQDYIKHLLTFYIENKEKFKDPLVKNYNLWKLVAPGLGMTPGECDKKFRNLKQTYIRLAEKKRDTGKCNGWPYYSYFEQIYGNSEIPSMDNNRSNIYVGQKRKTLVSIQQDYDREKFKKLVVVMEDSNRIQRERNRILQALLRKNNNI